jgi:cytochrome c oxidase subunit II
MATMKSGEHARTAGRILKAVGLSVALFLAPQALFAKAPESPAASAPAAVSPAASDAPVAATTTAAVAAPAAPSAEVAAGKYVPMKPTAGKGMPVAGGIDVQDQYSPIGQQARPFHTALLWLSLIIAVFVLLLLLFVIIRFNKRMNPVPSKVSHNTLIEILWTGIPILILLVVFVPSMKLLGSQFKPAPANALTIKATGSQWLWTYSYPSNGGFEVVSNMLPEEQAIARGEPPHLAADNRMVVPVGEPIRMQVTAVDVIHSFAVPSLWFKIDAVPGKLNELTMTVNEPGVYYGQCSELCGARHGYMPITIEALPRPQYNAWVLEQGGELDGQPKPATAAPAAPAVSPAVAASATPAAAPAASAAASASPTPGV